ncbi:CDR ABC transporter [Penicillium sp. IBT 35674x]|nr:CDR ABC transporter [Penicillium sp. IBT 35674x]
MRKSGAALKNLIVSGFVTALSSQSTVADLIFALVDLAAYYTGNRRHHLQNLHNIDALVHPGVLLMTLSPPGSGCTTLLKLSAGEIHDITIDTGSELYYANAIEFCKTLRLVDTLRRWDLSVPSVKQLRISVHASFPLQLYETLARIFQQFWRTPSYSLSKIGLIVVTVAFSSGSPFQSAKHSARIAEQNFWPFYGRDNLQSPFLTDHATIRYPKSALRGSRATSKVSHMGSIHASQHASRDPLVLLLSPTLCDMATNTVHEKGVLIWLLILTFVLFSITFAHLAIAATEKPETAGNIANLCFSLTISFCGVLAGPGAYPHFWILMNRISPFHYLLSGLLSLSIGGGRVICLEQEFLHFEPRPDMTCGEYLGDFFLNLS